MLESARSLYFVWVNFPDLFRRHYAELVAFSMRRVESSAVAEEIVQDVMFGIWRRWDTLADHDELQSYLYRATLHAIWRHRRHLSLEEKYTNDASMEMQDVPSHDGTTERQDLVIAARRIVRDMPDRMREVFVLSRDQGLSYRQIAEVLSISQKTVEVQMGRALKRLRDGLK